MYGTNIILLLFYYYFLFLTNRQEVNLVTDSGRTQVLEASLPAKDFLLRTLSQVHSQCHVTLITAHSQLYSFRR
jgi:hypothetical protein